MKGFLNVRNKVAEIKTIRYQSHVPRKSFTFAQMIDDAQQG